MDLGGFAYLLDSRKHYTLTALEGIWKKKTLISWEFHINFLSLSGQFKKRYISLGAEMNAENLCSHSPKHCTIVSLGIGLSSVCQGKTKGYK